MSTNQLRIGVALCGWVGAIVLSASFAINPAPPAGSSLAQLAEFAQQHHNLIVLGGWSQGMGSLLLVIFALGVVHLAGAAQRLSGWLTGLAGATILMVSLAEIAFYLSAAQAAESGDLVTGAVSAALIKGMQHVFLIAPALLLPLGVVLLSSRLLPRTFAYTGLVIGAVLQGFGLVGLFNILQPVIDVLLVVQSGWFVAAGLTLMIRPADTTATRAANPAGQGQQPPVPA